LKVENSQEFLREFENSVREFSVALVVAASQPIYNKCWSSTSCVEFRCWHRLGHRLFRL